MRVVAKGSIKLLIINDKRIALAHTDLGLRAFDNLCPHQHEPLHKGYITPFGEVVCALHHYQFSIKSGKEVSNRCSGLKFYSLKIAPNGVYIDL